MKIGIDFDNTIICYDEIIHQESLKRGLIPKSLSPSKEVIRDYLRKQDQEKEWTELQGYIYGKKIQDARYFPGVETFFKESLSRSIRPCIISHKTIYPYLGIKYNLHKAAKEWLYSQAFYSEDIPAYFEETKLNKLERIRSTNCEYFIDDLPEIFLEESFPVGVKKILFDPQKAYVGSDKFIVVHSWDEVTQFFFVKKYGKQIRPVSK